MSEVFIAVLNMSLTASYVAAAVILARLLLKKAPKIFSYALWAVVLFRMICPFSFESILSLLPANPEPIPQDIVYTQTPTINSGITFVDSVVNRTIQTALPQVQPEAAVSINPMQTIVTIGSYIWLSGIVILIGYAVISYIRTKRRIFAATLVGDNILCGGNIFQTDRIQTPFVLGFIKPKIYMPLGIEASQYDYILKHEQVHIRHRDYLIKPFAFIALALHWFNPFIWASYFLMTKDMEMSCDEAVLKTANEDIRGDYASTLLNLSVKRINLISPIAFGENNIKERVKNVLKFKKPAFGIIILSVMAVFSLTVTLAANQVAAIIPNDTDKNIMELSNNDTHNGITVSIESVSGGNDTVFVKLKVETDEIVFDDSLEYDFGLWKIDISSNPNDFGKNLINGGGTLKEVDKELWTEHIRYLEIMMKVMYDAEVEFSLGDGQERVMVLEFFGYSDPNKYHERVTLVEGEWKLKFSYDTDDMDINLLSDPFMFYGKGLEGHNRLAQMTSIRLNNYGLECRYTAYEIAEALDFTADVILKDGTKIPLIKGSMGCALNYEGFMTFKTISPIDLREVSYIQIGDEIIAVNKDNIQDNNRFDPSHVFDTNKNGQSYGSAMYAPFPDKEPDLILAEAIDGTEGYVYESDLNDSPNNPEELLAITAKNQEIWENASVGQVVIARYIPLYAVDGKTVIGEFPITMGFKKSESMECPGSLQKD